MHCPGWDFAVRRGDVGTGLRDPLFWHCHAKRALKRSWGRGQRMGEAEQGTIVHGPFPVQEVQTNNRRLSLLREALIRWNSLLQDVAEAESIFKFKNSHIRYWRKKPTERLKHRNIAFILKSVSHVLRVEIILEEEPHCIIAPFIHRWVTLRARSRPDGSRV